MTLLPDRIGSGTLGAGTLGAGTLGSGTLGSGALGRRSAWLASLWCAVFAALHLYWAVGGDVGLASSAGADLASRRPPLFVWGGLWGTAALLLLGAMFSAALARGQPRGPLRRVAIIAAWLVGVVLLARGILVQLVLMTGIGGIASAVGALQTHWSLVLWNPWFILGGVAFLLTAHHSGPLSRTNRA